MTYPVTFKELSEGVRAELLRLRPSLKHFPADSELQQHWDCYRSIEDTAQEWLEWADANP